MSGSACEARLRAERALASTVQRSGPAVVLFDPDTLKDRLIDGGAAPYQTELLLAALAAHIPQHLLAAHRDDALRAIERAKTRLAGERPFARTDAAWSVDVWARCLGLARGAAAAGPLAMRVARDAATPAPRDATVDRPVDPSWLRGAPATAPLRAPACVLPARPARTTAMTWAGSVLSIVALAGVVSAADRFAATARREPTIAVAAAAAAEPMTKAKALASIAQPDGAASVATRAPAEPAVADPAARPTIVDTAVDAPLVADGRSHEVFVALDAPRRDVKAIAARFVSGDSVLWSPPKTIAVPDAGDAQERFAAGSVRILSPRPARAVFEYVAISRDGTRSAPFRRELRVAPDPNGTRAPGDREHRVVADLHSVR